MFTAIDISTSALVAQRARLDAIAGNIANSSTTRNERGELEPYKARHVTFQADNRVSTAGGGVGVRVSSVEISDNPPLQRYDPGHPDADPETGFVSTPNIDQVTQQVDALAAARAYEANIGVIEITRDLGAQTLRIIA